MCCSSNGPELEDLVIVREDLEVFYIVWDRGARDVFYGKIPPLRVVYKK